MFSSSAFSGLRNPFSSEFWSKLQEMSAIVAELASMQPELGAMVKEKKRVRQVVWFPAVLDTAPTPTSRVAWTYGFTEVNVGLSETASNTESPKAAGDFTSMTGARTGDAINVAESANTQSLAYGFNVGGGPPWYLSDAPFTACQFMPVPEGTIVFMRETIAMNGKVRYEFWAPNPILPACEEV